MEQRQNEKLWSKANNQPRLEKNHKTGTRPSMRKELQTMNMWFMIRYNTRLGEHPKYRIPQINNKENKDNIQIATKEIKRQFNIINNL